MRNPKRVCGRQREASWHVDDLRSSSVYCIRNKNEADKHKIVHDPRSTDPWNRIGRSRSRLLPDRRDSRRAPPRLSESVLLKILRESICFGRFWSRGFCKRPELAKVRILFDTLPWKLLAVQGVEADREPLGLWG